MWLLRIFGFIIIIFGALLTIGGVKLASLGGSLYYLLIGLTLIVSGSLCIVGRVAGIYVYFVAFLATFIWSLRPASTDGPWFLASSGLLFYLLSRCW
jgi:quinate dehydrogenase (quinone)